MIRWPSLLGGTHKLVSWLNRIRNGCIASEVKQVIGNGRLIENTDGKIIEIWGSGGIASAGVIHRVKSAAAEYLVCRTWDGTTEGSSDIYVSKPLDARQPASEAIAGITHTYTYTAGPDSLNDYRESNNGTTTEDQVVVPYWRPDCLIMVGRINYSGVEDPDENDIKLIEISARCWAKIV